MGILPESHVSRLKADLAKTLTNPVKVTVFTQEIECDYCKETRELLDEISSLTDKIELQVLDFVKDKEKAAEYGVDKVPAIVIEGSKKSGVKFYGVPAGYEFNTLIKDIVLVSRGETELTAETKRRLSDIKKPVHVKVFVTPTCPYCPGMVSLAHQFAMDNANITADMIEISEFPQLGIKYNVSGVPKTVINESVEVLGMQGEEEFVRQLEAATKQSPTYV
ncbi:MAG: protein disulfide oxidoreductase [Candidatus Bathyarchaeia archaeon]